MKCENCRCRPVCDRYKATGGVKSCEHHVEERKGHWIKRGNERKCSCCGFIYFSNDAGFNGCPSCLADMRKADPSTSLRSAQDDTEGGYG